MDKQAYIERTADESWLWLAERSARNGNHDFKVNDLHEQFLTITTVYWEPVIRLLVQRGNVMMPEVAPSTRFKNIVFKVDEVQALEEFPPLFPPPEETAGRRQNGRSKEKIKNGT